MGDLVRGLGPDVNDLVVLLAVGNQAVRILLINLGSLALRFLDEFFLADRNLHVVNTDGDTRLRGLLVAQILDPVGKNDRVFGARMAVGVVDEETQLFFRQLLVDYREGQLFRQQLADQHPANGCVHQLTLDPHLNLGLKMGRPMIVGHAHFVR